MYLTTPKPCQKLPNYATHLTHSIALYFSSQYMKLNNYKNNNSSETIHTTKSYQMKNEKLK